MKTLVSSSVLHGDARDLLAAMPRDSVDAIVTDPPYGLEFMGKAWDAPWRELAGARSPGGAAFQTWTTKWGEAARDALKPGGYLLAFGGTRTYHRLAAGLEDAGLEIRDCLAWLYGSGFPKSLNLDGGLGTALKPAFEPVVVARKPLAGTVAANVAEYGTGALRIDACRLPMDDADREAARVPQPAFDSPTGLVYGMRSGEGRNGELSEPHPDGRWPANVLLDEDAAAQLDEQTATLSAGNYPATRAASSTFNANRQQQAAARPGRTEPGGASRFFYVAKASRAERDAGLDAFDPQPADERHHYRGLPDPRMDREQERRDARNVHPTVKPVALMRWLVRLVAAPGARIVDPFCGSGTTGIAAALEQVEFVGIEQDAGYADLARARIRFWTEHGEDALAIVQARERADAERERLAAIGQTDLLSLLDEDGAA